MSAETAMLLALTLPLVGALGIALAGRIGAETLTGLDQ